MTTPNNVFFPPDIAGGVQDLANPTQITGQAFSYPESVIRVLAAFDLISVSARSSTEPTSPNLWDIWINPAELVGPTISPSDIRVWDGAQHVDLTPGHLAANIIASASAQGIDLGIGGGLDIASLPIGSVTPAADSLVIYDASTDSNIRATVNDVVASALASLGGDADTLDGIDSLQFARTDIAEAFTQNVTVQGSDVARYGSAVTTLNDNDTVALQQADGSHHEISVEDLRDEIGGAVPDTLGIGSIIVTNVVSPGVGGTTVPGSNVNVITSVGSGFSALNIGTWRIQQYNSSGTSNSFIATIIRIA